MTKRYEWQGASPFRDHRNDREVKPGEVVELNDHVAGPHPEFVAVEEDDDTTGESVEPPFDPSDATVDELREMLEDIPDDVTDAELDALYEAEQADEARDTALEALDNAR